MQTTKWFYFVEPHDISYLRYTLESYDGMVMLKTVDPGISIVELNIAPGCEEMVSSLIKALNQEEGIKLARKDDQTLTFYIKTMGCQMNEYDSDCVALSLINAGFHPADRLENADLVLVNTCTVRAKPDQKVYSLLGRIHAIKQKRPDMIVGVMGCLAQRYGKRLIKRFPFVDMIVGPREIDRIPTFFRDIEENGKKIVATTLNRGIENPHLSRGYFKGRVTGFISIMQGCNNFCTYCIVPYVRGREISRPVEDIYLEAERLVSEGIKDITLLGQNVNSYRWVEGKQFDFPYLLKVISGIKGLKRLRFTTSHPKDLSPMLISCFGEIEILCNHIHLPFQSGSNQVLSRMNRGYTREEYLDLIKRLRETRPDVAITTDVIVGFPGETEEDFERTLDLLREVRFDSAFSFKYSDRKGTRAEKMGPKVPEEVKSRRLALLQDLQKNITSEKHRALEGTVQEVLVEGYSRYGRQFTGRTTTNKTVNFPCNNEKIGEIVNVVIKKGYINSLLAERVHNE